jgi:hypothetical protein
LKKLQKIKKSSSAPAGLADASGLLEALIRLRDH